MYGFVVVVVVFVVFEWEWAFVRQQAHLNLISQKLGILGGRGVPDIKPFAVDMPPGNITTCKLMHST